MLTKKDFEAIAEVLKSERARWYEAREDALLATDALDSVANELAAVLSFSNPRFDRAWFLAACGYQTSKSD
jgi:hypothetical protein